MFKKTHLVTLNGKPVSNVSEYMLAGKICNPGNNHLIIKQMWEKAADDLQNHLGSQAIVKLVKCGSNLDGYAFYKLIAKPVIKLKKVILFVPLIKKKIKGSNKKYFESSYLNNQVLNQKKQFIKGGL